LKTGKFEWCRGGDSNPDRLTPTTPSRWRVYQFHHLGKKENGRGGRARTHDLRFWRPLLYQLSYTPMPNKIIVYPGI
jgi:hypothetical protein